MACFLLGLKKHQAIRSISAKKPNTGKYLDFKKLLLQSLNNTDIEWHRMEDFYYFDLFYFIVFTIQVHNLRRLELVAPRTAVWHWEGVITHRSTALWHKENDFLLAATQRTLAFPFSDFLPATPEIWEAKKESNTPMI